MLPIRLIVVFGGRSAEHDVSCATASHVLAAADPAHYEIEAVGVTRQGQFVQAEEAMAALAKGVDSLPAALVPEGKGVSLTAVASSRPDSDQQVVVFPLIHGPLGEDGTLQGMLEMAGIPYVGSGVLGSAVTMDKVMAKTLVGAAGIPQTRWTSLDEADEPSPQALAAIAERLGYPIFVKPANMGSSVGVGKATNFDELQAAVAKAFSYDQLLVLEEGVEAREIELALLGNHDIRVSVPGEIRPAADFYDYEDKYNAGEAELLVPAPISAELTTELQALAKQAYRALRCEGMARADFLVEEGGRGPLLNELNTIPGFTPISMYPKTWEASGLSYGKLIDELVRLALERHQRRSAKRITR